MSSFSLWHRFCVQNEIHLSIFIEHIAGCSKDTIFPRFPVLCLLRTSRCSSQRQVSRSTLPQKHRLPSSPTVCPFSLASTRTRPMLRFLSFLLRTGIPFPKMIPGNETLLKSLFPILAIVSFRLPFPCPANLVFLWSMSGEGDPPVWSLVGPWLACDRPAWSRP